jgi:hypothetical protein
MLGDFGLRESIPGRQDHYFAISAAEGIERPQQIGAKFGALGGPRRAGEADTGIKKAQQQSCLKECGEVSRPTNAEWLPTY